MGFLCCKQKLMKFSLKLSIIKPKTMIESEKTSNDIEEEVKDIELEESDEILPLNDGTTPNIEKSTWKYIAITSTSQLLEKYVDKTT